VRNSPFALISPVRALNIALAIAVLLIVLGYLEIGIALRPAARWGVALVLLITAFAAHARLLATRICMEREIARLIASLVGSADTPVNAAELRILRGRISPQLDDSIRIVRDRLDELQREKRQAETVLSNMADGIIAVTSDGRVTVFNRAAEIMFLRGAGSTIGRKIDESDIHPQLSHLAYECSKTRAEIDTEIRLPGWPQRVISARATPFRHAGSGPGSSLIILHDLTEVRRHENNQREFVSNVSHELRTPLTAVRTTAETLLNYGRGDEEMLGRFLNTIITETDRLSALIDDLMDIARRDAGVVTTEKTQSKVLELINRAASVILPLAREKNIRLAVDAPESLIAHCDYEQMVQAVRNLIDNAVKYTPAGGAVDVEACEGGEGVRITVRDTGLGIPQGDVDRIFERFYRVDKTRSRALGGTGLGLAIVKDIVDAHGGSVNVETDLGKGSSFTIEIPARPGTRSVA